MIIYSDQIVDCTSIKVSREGSSFEEITIDSAK